MAVYGDGEITFGVHWVMAVPRMKVVLLKSVTAMTGLKCLPATHIHWRLKKMGHFGLGGITVKGN